jgi:hypothetical protein
MASVNEQLVGDYLESLGFLLRQPRKYQVIARGKAPFEEADWLGVNPAMPELLAVPERRPKPGLWGAAELARVPGVAVAVRGWHTDRFTAAMLENSPEIWRFAEPEAMRASSAALGMERPAPVLFLADLPSAPEERAAALEVLARHGVEGVVPFRTMLLDLLDRVDVKRNYEKSDMMQVLRILKTHRLTRTRQMMLEDVVRTRRKSAGGAAGGAAKGSVAETGELALEHVEEGERAEIIENFDNAESDATSCVPPGDETRLEAASPEEGDGE